MLQVVQVEVEVEVECGGGGRSAAAKGVLPVGWRSQLLDHGAKLRVELVKQFCNRPKNNEAVGVVSRVVVQPSKWQREREGQVRHRTGRGRSSGTMRPGRPLWAYIHNLVFDVKIPPVPPSPPCSAHPDRGKAEFCTFVFGVGVHFCQQFLLAEKVEHVVHTAL